MAIQLIPILIDIAIAIAISTVAYLITPKPKQPKPETRELDKPTADAGRPIPVIFGMVDVTDPNVLWYGEITTNNRKVG